MSRRGVAAAKPSPLDPKEQRAIEALKATPAQRRAAAAGAFVWLYESLRRGDGRARVVEDRLAARLGRGNDFEVRLVVADVPADDISSLGMVTRFGNVHARVVGPAGEDTKRVVLVGVVG